MNRTAALFGIVAIVLLHVVVGCCCCISRDPWAHEIDPHEYEPLPPVEDSDDWSRP